MPLSELTSWVISTYGREHWTIDANGTVRIPDQRAVNILSHYEREYSKGHMTLPTAYEACTNDLQGRNAHPTKPQRGKSYRAVTLGIAGKGQQKQGERAS